MREAAGRFALALVMSASFATTAAAWDYTPGLPCLLTYQSPEVEVALTYDPTAPLYTISITDGVARLRPAIFALRFEGPAALTISTDQHVLTEQGKRLSVADTGFGNVLNGLQFNRRMVAVIGDQTISVPLEGASGPVAQFRECKGGAPSA
jgi:hypothetical protein